MRELIWGGRGGRLLQLPHLRFPHQQVPKSDSFPHLSLQCSGWPTPFSTWLHLDLPADGPEQEKKHIAGKRCFATSLWGTAAAAATQCRVWRGNPDWQESRLLFVLFVFLNFTAQRLLSNIVFWKTSDRSRIHRGPLESDFPLCCCCYFHSFFRSHSLLRVLKVKSPSDCHIPKDAKLALCILRIPWGKYETTGLVFI